MKTSRAGRAEANIIHKGKWPYRPRGWMTQPRAEELDTLRPSGTESFCEGRRQLVRTWGQADRERWGLGSRGPGAELGWIAQGLAYIEPLLCS